MLLFFISRKENTMKNKFTLSVIIALFVVFLTSGAAAAYNEIARAIKDGDIKQVKLLIKEIDINKVISSRGVIKGTLLMLAAHKGHTEIAKLLLNNGADVNALDYYNNTALALAAREGHVDTVKLLLDHDANINVNNRLGLYYAVESGHTEIAKLLL